MPRPRNGVPAQACPWLGLSAQASVRQRRGEIVGAGVPQGTHSVYVCVCADDSAKNKPLRLPSSSERKMGGFWNPFGLHGDRGAGTSGTEFPSPGPVGGVSASPPTHQP